MQALVFNGPGQKRLEDRPKPAVNLPSDAIVAIVGSGPIGLAALLTAQLYSPAQVQAKRIDAAKLITHRFKLADILQAYDTFAKPAETQALKVIIEA
jgi:threonine dehydrogenase-like Zn-dependent dehydrogenase